MSRKPLETKTIVSNVALNQGINEISKQFPIGGMVERIRLVFKHTVVIGTGAGAKTLGGYGIVKSVNFKTDRGEVVYDQVPALGIYPLMYRNDRVDPAHDAIAAASAVYVNVVDVIFGFSWLSRPEDLYLNTKNRYKSLELVINMGTVADLFTAPGTAIVASTVDIIMLYNRASSFYANQRQLDLSLPHKIPYVKHMPVVDPSAVAYWDLESAPDFRIMEFYLSKGSTATAGVPYANTPDDGIGEITFKDDDHTWLDQATLGNFRQLRKKLLGADLIGLYIHPFAPNGSYKEAYKTANRSLLQLQMSTITGAVPQADVLLVGYRDPQ